MRDIPRAREMLEVAIGVIDQSGEAGIRVREIAESCGVTTPILYRAFGSREGLIIDAQTERYVRTWTAVGDQFLPEIIAAATVDELKATVTRMLAVVLSSERAEARRIRASVLGSAISRPALKSAIQTALTPVVARSAAAFEVARSRGLIRDSFDLEAAVWWYLGLTDGRLFIEQMSVPVDGDAWNEVARHAVFALLFHDHC